MTARRTIPDPPQPLLVADVLSPVAIPVRCPSGETRSMICAACSEVFWTAAKKADGKCGPCRVKGCKSTRLMMRESICVLCRRVIYSRYGTARYHPECRGAERRLYAAARYARMKAA